MSDTVEKTLSRIDNRIHVQILDKSKWFIPLGRQPTEGNVVRPLIDGRQAMAEMALAFTDANFIYVAGWQMDDNVQLLRDTGTDQSLLRILGDAVSGGADVRALMWDGSIFLGGARPDPADPSDTLNLAASNERTAREFRRRGIQAILDDHNQKTVLGTTNLGSIHQKMAVADGGFRGPVAFCGGIDLAYKRWDFPAHPAFDSRRDPSPSTDDPDEMMPFHNPDPWHDVHAVVRGPAVEHLEANFIERWNSHQQGPALSPRATSSPVPGGTHIVQVLRTLPGDDIHSFAPRGEFGIRTAYLRAIRCARNYIYIENQYLVSETITDELVAAMNRANQAGRDFRLIVVVPYLPEEAAGSGGSAGSGGGGQATIFHQNRMIARLRAAAPNAQTFQVFYLRQPAGNRNIYVHAKVMIVDDIWTTIGSANLNRRGMCFDAELNIAVVDTAVSDGRRRFARDFRLALWQEHLGLREPADLLQIQDPIAGAAMWAARAGSNQSHIVRFDETENPGDDGFLWEQLVDPLCTQDADEIRAWEESINTT